MGSFFIDTAHTPVQSPAERTAAPASPPALQVSYFTREGIERDARITLSCSGKIFSYEAIARLCVRELAACEIALFGAPLVVSMYVHGYRATWSPGCVELGRTYRAEEGAFGLLQTAHDAALAYGGFEQNIGYRPRQSGSASASQQRREAAPLVLYKKSG